MVDEQVAARSRRSEWPRPSFKERPSVRTPCKYRPAYPPRFGSYEHAVSYCRDFFAWYNANHRHAGIAMLTPDVVHHGRADDVLAARQRVLDAAYADNPERFVNGPPLVQRLPSRVWINPPEDKARSVIDLQ